MARYEVIVNYLIKNDPENYHYSWIITSTTKDGLNETIYVLIRELKEEFGEELDFIQVNVTNYDEVTLTKVNVDKLWADIMSEYGK